MTPNHDLPDGWRRPVSCNQKSLFPAPKEEFLAQAGVSADELKRWRRLGWISFDPDAIAEFHTPEVYETCFVRNIARWGLSDAQITELLTGLPKPYAYDPFFTAFSFTHGWVQAVPPPAEQDTFDVVEENLTEWLKAQAEGGNLDRLEDLGVEVVRLISARQQAVKSAGGKGSER